MFKHHLARTPATTQTTLRAALLFALLSAFAFTAHTQTTAPTPNSGPFINDRPKPTATPTATTTPKPVAAAPKQLKLGKVNVSGSLRLRAESYGWFETPGFQDEYTFRAAQLRVSLGQQRDRFDWLVEGQLTGLVNLPERAVAPAPQGQLGLGASYFAANRAQDASAALKQAFVRPKGVFGDKRSSLRVGRFEFVDGAETTPLVYARFPFYNLMNNEDVFAALQLKPHARLVLRAEVHALRLGNAKDLWYAGGGAFQESSFGFQGRPSGGARSLGTLFDLGADLTLTPTTTLTLYGAGVRGGLVLCASYPAGGPQPTARLLYVELTRRS